MKILRSRLLVYLSFSCFAAFAQHPHSRGGNPFLIGAAFAGLWFITRLLWRKYKDFFANFLDYLHSKGEVHFSKKRFLLFMVMTFVIIDFILFLPIMLLIMLMLKDEFVSTILMIVLLVVLDIFIWTICRRKYSQYTVDKTVITTANDKTDIVLTKQIDIESIKPEIIEPQLVLDNEQISDNQHIVDVVGIVFPKFCPNCGKEVNYESVRFCKYCGKQLKTE